MYVYIVFKSPLCNIGLEITLIVLKTVAYGRFLYGMATKLVNSI